MPCLAWALSIYGVLILLSKSAFMCMPSIFRAVRYCRVYALCILNYVTILLGLTKVLFMYLVMHVLTSISF